MTDEFEKYCKAHKTTVTIDRQSSGEETTLLVCKHSFDSRFFECNLPCVYSLGAQMGAKIVADMGGARLNSDGTIPLDVIKQAGCVDQTKENDCFIATAVYGSSFAPEVIILRQFRDIRLRQNLFGRWVIRIYEECSPPFADWIVKHPSVRSWVRKLVLSHMVWIVHRWTS